MFRLQVERQFSCRSAETGAPELQVCGLGWDSMERRLQGRDAELSWDVGHIPVFTRRNHGEVKCRQRLADVWMKLHLKCGSRLLRSRVELLYN